MFEEIRDRIRLLAEIDRECLLFGAPTHQYQVAPPLDEAAVQAMEARLGVELPAEYRKFLLEVGASGAGPYYGLRDPQIPDNGNPRRPFPFTAEAPPDAPVPGSRFDGAIVIAEQGCAYLSLLIVTGPRRGEVWTDLSAGDGWIVPEAPSFVAWYGAWIERALVEWLERAAPRIALDGPEDPSELEAIGIGFESVAAAAKEQPLYRRTLGYLHLREHRYEDAVAAFVAAADGGKEPQARLHLDRARLHLVKDDPVRAIEEANAGLACGDLWVATKDELRTVLERALFSEGRADAALAVLDERAADRNISFDLHHRLTRERLARGDLAGAGAALERAANVKDILGHESTREARVGAAFDPIISELRAAGRGVDADALQALADRILQAN